MSASQVVDLLKSTPGLSDREIADRLIGKNSPPQPVNAICRRLEAFGVIVRVREAGASTRNYIAGDRIMAHGTQIPVSARLSGLELPADVSGKLKLAGELWANSAIRPRIDPETAAYWDLLIDQWAECLDLPLVFRKATSQRGTSFIHRTGRQVIWADNAPAQWAFQQARKALKPSLEAIKQLLRDHKIPFAFAFASSSKGSEAEYPATLQSCKVEINREGWKLCHLDDVSTRKRTPPRTDDIENLKTHFKRLMKPSNHFLVPKRWSGFGELPEIIEAIRHFESASP